MNNNKSFNVFHSGIIDNHSRGNVADFLREKIEKDSSLSIISADFSIYAFAELREQLYHIKQLNFLFSEPSLINNDDNGEENLTKLPLYDRENDQIELIKKLLQSKIARDCQKWVEEKVNIRSIKQQVNFLSTKMYHISIDDRESAILGSANFSVKGLGLSDNNNLELNLIVENQRDTTDLKQWFNQVWHNRDLVIDVKNEVIDSLQQLYENNTPQFIYYKTLFTVFTNFLEEEKNGDRLIKKERLPDTKIWNLLLEFQKDGVKRAITKIFTYNGCILADSISLDKIFEALAIIKYFELLNYKVLVLCPKKFRENWTNYNASNNSELNILLEDKLNFTVLSYDDLSTDSEKKEDDDFAKINFGNYDLIVIDESHNFCNNTTTEDKEKNLLKKSPYENLLEDIIKSSNKTKLLLLSNPFIKTNLTDLSNQLNLILSINKSNFNNIFNLKNIQDLLIIEKEKFTNWSIKNNRKNKDLLNTINDSFFYLLDALTIARSRKHIKQYYPNILNKLDGFPSKLVPISIFYSIDLDNNNFKYDYIYDKIYNYELSIFKPSNYVLDHYKNFYQSQEIPNNSTQKNRENYLINMIRINFLKRLESSISSFKITLEKTIHKIDSLIHKIEQFKKSNTEILSFENDTDNDNIFIKMLFDDQVNIKETAPENDQELETTSIHYDYKEEKTKNLYVDDKQLEEAFAIVEKNVKYDLHHLNVNKWLEDLITDKHQLYKLFLQAEEIDENRDAKLYQLKKLIKNKIKNPSINKLGKPNRKVIVFTAFTDTATYIYDSLHHWVKSNNLKIHLALVIGEDKNKTTFNKNKLENIFINFSPLSKKRDKFSSLPQTGEIDILIATDCISEGQNLQDCDYLINYDIHWNPVRIMQRFGYIDRLGSLNDSIQLVNFWATPDLDKYLNFKNRVESQMALVDLICTGDNNLLSLEKLLIEKNLAYQDSQLLRLKDEILDLEDFDDSISLTDFNLEDFRIDLLNYFQQHQKKLENTPTGLYAVVPPHSDYPLVQSGVIFCLQYKGNSQKNSSINSLYPYFLVYITKNKEDTDVFQAIAKPKQILEIYRLLCQDQNKIYEELSNLFDQQMDNDHQMSQYNELLIQAVEYINNTFFAQQAKFASDNQKHQTSNFDLITWLIIK